MNVKPLPHSEFSIPSEASIDDLEALVNAPFTPTNLQRLKDLADDWHEHLAEGLEKTLLVGALDDFIELYEWHEEEKLADAYLVMVELAKDYTQACQARAQTTQARH